METCVTATSNEISGFYFDEAKKNDNENIMISYELNGNSVDVSNPRLFLSNYHSNFRRAHEIYSKAKQLLCNVVANLFVKS